MNDFRAQAETAFAIELARDATLRALVQLYGRDAVEMAWKLGWFSGMGAGLDKVKQVMG